MGQSNCRLIYWFAGSSLYCGSNETVYSLWNTTAGGIGTLATSGSNVGNYYPTEIPSYSCDNNITTVYTAFGQCTSANSLASCGLNTGFYRTPQRGASMITGLQLCTIAGLPTRDPITITYEVSNQTASVLALGSSWTLIYSGASGLATDPGRSTCGTQASFNNTVWYSSYRFLVTSKRGAESSTAYAELRLIGY